MNPKTRLVRCLVVFAVVALLAVSSLGAECYDYSNSHIIFINAAPNCGSIGGSCGECIFGFGGGFTVCTRDSTGFEMCIDYMSW